MKPRFARRLVQFRDRNWVEQCVRSKVRPDDWLPVLYSDNNDILVDKLGHWDLSRFELRCDLGYKNKKKVV